jgi:outer membrane protein OmpA-like peptidoglycan-associated protein
MLTCERAQAQVNDEYYVTIGAFSRKENAVRFTARASRMGFPAQYAINTNRKLYYVYLLQSPEKRKAYAFCIKMKADTEFKDAWVFYGRLGEQTPIVEEKIPVVEKPAEEVKKPVEEAKPIIEDAKPVIETVVEQPKVDSSAIVKPVARKVAQGKFFEFKFVNESNGNEIRGEVHLSESLKATQYQAFKANELIDLAAPRNAAGVYFVTTIAPGYKTWETQISYKDPLPSSSGNGPDGEFVIPITLERAKRGDYIEFNNVSFYRNSVVMQEKFQAEMDGLVDLMKEHTNYKVRIHGHCNGMESRDIITLGTSDKFFASDPRNEKKSASAKELTELRAEAARRYLVSQGIEVERILTKGEGGKMMIYPPTSVYANYNDRIEVEVVRH